MRSNPGLATRNWKTLSVNPAVNGYLFQIREFYVKVFYVMGNALLGELSCMQTGLVQCSLFQSHHLASRGVPFGVDSSF